eukprot:scaffold1475_cov167-Amphora_coffeaeformis.AAC.6
MGDNVRIAKFLLVHSSLKPTDIDTADFDGLTTFHITGRDGNFQVANMEPLRPKQYQGVDRAASCNFSRQDLDCKVAHQKLWSPFISASSAFHAIELDSFIGRNVTTEHGLDSWQKDGNRDTVLVDSYPNYKRNNRTYPIKTVDCEGGDGSLPFFTTSAGHLVDETFAILMGAAEEGLFDQISR